MLKKKWCLILLPGIFLGLGFSVILHYADSQSDVSQASIEFQNKPVMDYTQGFEKLRSHFHVHDNELTIVVKLSKQQLYLVNAEGIVKTYPISGSVYGAGNRVGSNQTPLGSHKISNKIGSGAPLGTVFRSRVNTGEVAEIYTDDTDVEDDLVTTRIMWLRGLEPGVNQGLGIDSHARYIYIHGTQEEGLIGRPASHGCIRMKNQDVIELFDLVQEGTLVEIQE